MKNEVLNNPRIGARDGMTICIGYIAISFSFGIMATGAGLSILETIFISIFNLSSAGQLAALPMLAGNGSLIELLLTQLIINARYALMSISLSQKFNTDIGIKHRFLYALDITDEIFATGIRKGMLLGKKYLLGILIPPYIGWTLGTALGAIMGNILPESLTSALGISMYATFIALFIPAAKRSLPIALCVLLGIGLSCLFHYLPALSVIPEGFIVIICAGVCSLLFAILFPIPDEDDEQGSENDGANEQKEVKV